MSDNKDRTLYCGNLSEKVTEDLLYELFLQAGPLENVTIPKDKEGNRRNFAFITFKYAVSVPYTLALMNGISLYGKSLKLDARTGAASEHNPYLEKLFQYRQTVSLQSMPMNKNYNMSPREPYQDQPRRYDSRQYEPRPESQRDYNQWNPPYSPQPGHYNTGMSVTYPSQGRFQNSIPQTSYPSGLRGPWQRNHR